MLIKLIRIHLVNQLTEWPNSCNEISNYFVANITNHLFNLLAALRSRNGLPYKTALEILQFFKFYTDKILQQATFLLSVAISTSETVLHLKTVMLSKL